MLFGNIQGNYRRVFYKLVISLIIIHQAFMKKSLSLIPLLLLLACGKKGEFVEDIQGHGKLLRCNTSMITQPLPNILQI